MLSKISFKLKRIISSKRINKANSCNFPSLRLDKNSKSGGVTTIPNIGDVPNNFLNLFQDLKKSVESLQMQINNLQQNQHTQARGPLPSASSTRLQPLNSTCAQLPHTTPHVNFQDTYTCINASSPRCDLSSTYNSTAAAALQQQQQGATAQQQTNSWLQKQQEAAAQQQRDALLQTQQSAALQQQSNALLQQQMASEQQNAQAQQQHATLYPPQTYNNTGNWQHQPATDYYSQQLTYNKSMPQGTRDVERIVRGWNLKYSDQDSQSIELFLTRIEEKRKLACLTDEEVMSALLELFTGVAAVWYRNNMENLRN